MPEIFVYLPIRHALRIDVYVPQIEMVLKKATIAALPELKGDLDSVEVTFVPSVMNPNNTEVKIFGVASHKKERELHLISWRESLSEAWQNLRESKTLIAIQDILNSKTYVWATLPVGEWAAVPDPK